MPKKKRATKKNINGDNMKTIQKKHLAPLFDAFSSNHHNQSINLYSNSMISHNALPFLSSLAISMDWIHFMAVSI